MSEFKMRASNRYIPTVFALVLLSGSAPAQTEASEDARGRLRNGFHLYQVEVSSGYSTFDQSLSGTSYASEFGRHYLQGALSGGYSHYDATTQFVATYTPSLLTQFTVAARHQFNQSFLLRFGWRINPKWRLAVWGRADDNGVQQYATQASAAPGESDGGGLQSSALSGGDPIRSLLYGGRRLQYGGHASLTGNPTTRWSVTLAGSAFQTQARSTSAAAETVPLFVPRSRYEYGVVSAAYALTSRNALGVQGSTLFYHTREGDYRSTMQLLTYTRGLTPHWALMLQGGTGQSTALSTGAADRSGNALVGGAGVGYQGPEHAFTLSYMRSRGDLSGLAAQSTQASEASWKYHPRGRWWEVHSSVRRRALTGGSWGDGMNWEVNGGMTRMFGRQITSSLEYVYLKTSVGAAQAYTLSGHFVRLSFTLIPTIGETEGPDAVLGTAKSGRAEGWR